MGLAVRSISLVESDEVARLAEAAQVVTGLKESDLTRLGTPDLVDRYKGVKEIERESGKVVKNMKAELTERMGDGVEDAKGIIRLAGGQAPQEGVEFRPRTRVQFLPDEARRILEAKNLLEHAVETETVVRDPEKLVDILEKVQEVLIQQGNATLAQEIESVFEATTERRDSISQVKIEALHKKGRVSDDEVEEMHAVSTSFALYG